MGINAPPAVSSRAPFHVPRSEPKRPLVATISRRPSGFVPAPACVLIGRFIRSVTLGAAAGAPLLETIGPGGAPPPRETGGVLTPPDTDTGAGNEIDVTEMPDTAEVPPDTCGAAMPMPAARIAVKPAMAALFCMVAAVFMSVDTRTGSFDVPRNSALMPPCPSDPYTIEWSTFATAPPNVSVIGLEHCEVGRLHQVLTEVAWLGEPDARGVGRVAGRLRRIDDLDEIQADLDRVAQVLGRLLEGDEHAGRGSIGIEDGVGERLPRPLYGFPKHLELVRFSPV